MVSYYRFYFSCCIYGLYIVLQNSQTDKSVKSVIKTQAPLTIKKEIFGEHLNKRSLQKLKKEKIGVNRPEKTRRWIRGTGFQMTTDKQQLNDVQDEIDSPIIGNDDIGEIDIEVLKKEVNINDTSYPTKFPSRCVYVWVYMQMSKNGYF